MIRELAEGIWSCEQDDGPRIVRQIVVAGDEAVLVVDTGLPGAPAAELVPLLTRLGRRDLAVLITHPDSDHLGGTAELLAVMPAARVLAGAPDLPLVGDPERMIRDRYARFSQHDDVPFGAAAIERARTRAGKPFSGAEAALPGTRIELGGRAAEIVATPGHSPGHVSAFIADARLLAAGDSVMGNGIPTREGRLLIPPMYAPPAAYRETIERVGALPLRILATGHEPMLEGEAIAAFLATSRTASDRLAELVAAAVDGTPRTLLELCERVHAAYGGLPDERAADLALTVDGHLSDLIASGLVVVTPDSPRRFRGSSA
jgi:glyoxylase-like metal-dependent hydrolase (beta-lactamase superfamily II)